LLVAGETTLSQSRVGLLLTRHARLEGGRVGLLLAGRVEGDIQAVVGPRTAALMAAVGGAVLGILLGVITRRKGRGRTA
jgi:membrane associated rhomboid family serine protease